MTTYHINHSGWSFGSLQDRKTPEKWLAMYGFVSNGVCIYAPAVCFAGFSLASAFWLLGRWLKHEQLLAAEQLRRRWLAVIGCILLYFSGPLVFFNLYYIHDYYWCANTIFLVVAMGLCVVTMIEMGKGSRVAGMVILLLVIAGSLQTYSGYYYRDQIGQFEAIPVMAGKAYNDSVLAISCKIEENTRPEELLVSFHDWNTDLAYYSKRRSINPPFFLPESLEQQIGDMAKIQGEAFGALVIDRIGGEKYAPDKILKIMERNGFETHYIATEGRLELYSLEKAPSGIKVKR